MDSWLTGCTNRSKYFNHLLGCSDQQSPPSQEALDQLHLKKGQIIVCGAPDKEFGTANFDVTGSQQVKNDFNTAIELLHSFEYDEAEKVFAKIIDESPECVMAYWGVAMCNFHPLWEPPSEVEAAIFFALALDASADPMDKTFAHQKKAGAMLDSMYISAPNHPGIIHYIIHTYDYPGLADRALQAARRYAEVAPSSAHAFHMPSHIFTRLGLWDESIRLNTRSVEAAQCYAQSAGIKGHWDEELHGLDYLIYAYLQKGDIEAATGQLKYLASIRDVYPINFKEAYTFAASPCRWALENKNWSEATLLSLQPSSFPWGKFPWQEAIVHFGRLLGAVHTAKLPVAKKELARLDTLHSLLMKQAGAYKARQVEIQQIAGQAWIAQSLTQEMPQSIQ